MKRWARFLGTVAGAALIASMATVPAQAAGPISQTFGCDVVGISTTAAPWATTWSTTVNGSTSGATVFAGEPVTLGFSYSNGFNNGGPSATWRGRMVAEAVPSGQQVTSDWVSIGAIPNGTPLPGGSMAATFTGLPLGTSWLRVRNAQFEAYLGASGPLPSGALAGTVNCNGQTTHTGFTGVNPTTTPIPFGDTPATVVSSTVSVASVVGQVPGIAAIRPLAAGVPIGVPNPAISLTGTGGVPNLAVGQITADVCQPGACSSASASATDLSTNGAGDLSGSFTPPRTEFPSPGIYEIRLYDTFGNTVATTIRALGTPTVTVTPASVAVGGNVSVVGSEFNPLGAVEVQQCISFAPVGPGPCGLGIPSGTASGATANSGGQFFLSPLVVDNPAVTVILAKQSGTYAATSISVQVTASTTSLTVPASVGFPADGVAAQINVTGLADGATGTVVANVYGPGDPTCSGPPIATDDVQVGPAQFQQAAGEVVLPLGGTGVYRWTASFEGDGSNDSSTACNAPGSVTEVTPALGQIDVAVDSPQVEIGDSTTPTATLSGVTDAATGSIDFALYAGTSCFGPPLASQSVPVNGANAYSPAGVTLALAGPYVWSVSYSGDAGHSAIGPVCDTENASVTAVSVPGPVTNLTVTSPSNDNVDVSWTAPTYTGELPIDSYSLLWREPGTFDVLRIDTVDATTTAVSLSGFAPSYTYVLDVVTQNAVGDSSVARLFEITPNRLPSAPTAVLLTSDGHSQVTAQAAGSFVPFSTYIEYELLPGGPTQTGPVEAGSSVLPVTFNGLTNGQEYTVRARAVNAFGQSAWVTSNPATPQAVAPSAPTGVNATGGPGQAYVSWSVGDTGGSPITVFRIRNQNGDVVATEPGPAAQGETRFHLVTGLTNGTPVSFTVEQSSALGTSPPSAPSNTVTPLGLPSAPQNVSAEPRVNAIRVAWSPPADTGGSPVTNYIIRNLGTGAERTVSGTATAVTIGSLTPGTLYAFTVRARTAVGESGEALTAPVSPAAGAPSTPSAPTAVAGPAKADVAWTAPADDGGAAIEAYQVRATNTGTAATITRTRNDTSTAYTFTGLTNGQTYTFEVRARNAANVWSPWSAASSPVTPVTVPGAPTTVAGTAYNAAARVTWGAPTSNGGSSVISYQVSLSIGTAPPIRQITVSAGDPLQASFTGLTNGTTYRINVKAVNVVGSSTNTGYVSVRPLASRPPLP